MTYFYEPSTKLSERSSKLQRLSVSLESSLENSKSKKKSNLQKYEYSTMWNVQIVKSFARTVVCDNCKGHRAQFRVWTRDRSVRLKFDLDLRIWLVQRDYVRICLGMRKYGQDVRTLEHVWQISHPDSEIKIWRGDWKRPLLTVCWKLHDALDLKTHESYCIST